MIAQDNNLDLSAYFSAGKGDYLYKNISKRVLPSVDFAKATSVKGCIHLSFIPDLFGH